MTITNKKPLIKKSVGAQFVAINTPDVNGDYDPATFEGTIKQETVKTIGVTENSATVQVRSSKIIYETVSTTSSTEIATDVVAFDPETLSKLRADSVDPTTGLVLKGKQAKRPFFAYGYTEYMINGGVKYIWYPKCQLISNTQDIATEEESFSEQNDTITISAMSFDDAGNNAVELNSQFTNFPSYMTEDLFFEHPILKVADIPVDPTP